MVLSLYNAIDLYGGENSAVNRLLSVAEDLAKNFPDYSTGPSIKVVNDGVVLDVEPESNSPSIGKNQSVTMVKDTNELGYNKPDSLVNLNPATVNTPYGQVTPTNRINVTYQFTAWMING